jgi:hypothetical protein
VCLETECLDAAVRAGGRLTDQQVRLVLRSRGSSSSTVLVKGVARGRVSERVERMPLKGFSHQARKECE